MAKYPMKDLVVILPGITGSVLNDGADAVWGLSTGALWQFVKSRGNSLQRLEVPQHDPRNGAPAGDVRATALVNGFHGVFGLAKIDGYGPLVAALQQRFQVTPGGWDDDHPANLVTFPYDWRLSNRASARRLGEGIDQKLARWRAHSGAGDAKVILIAHSMGGLVSRYWIEVLQGWRECRALVSFGTPYRGSLDAVGYLANGYKKAFVDLTSVLLSCPSVYELLPVYRAVQRGDEWFRPHELELPVVDPARHALAQDYVAAAAEFHREIREAVEQNRSDPQYLGACTVVPFVGVHQTTGQSAVLDGDQLTVSDAVPSWFEDDVGGGDGTVPRVSATPIEMDSPFGAAYLAAKHGTMHTVGHGLDDLVERLRQSQAKHMGSIQGSLGPPSRAVDLVVDDLYLPEEPVVLRGRSVDANDVSDRRSAAGRGRA